MSGEEEWAAFGGGQADDQNEEDDGFGDFGGDDGFGDFGDFEQAENKVEIKSNEIGIIGNIGC